MKYIQGLTKEYEISQNDCYYNMLCRLEDNIHKLNNDDIQNKPGVYIFFDWDNKPLRIGKAVKLRNRLLSYYTNPVNYNLFSKFQQSISFVSVIYTTNDIEAALLELELIKRHKPQYNKHSKD